MSGEALGVSVLRAAGALDGSIVATPGGGAMGVRTGHSDWELLAWAPAHEHLPRGLAGSAAALDGGPLLVGPASRVNAAVLRESFPWLRPRRLGDGPSFGFGDRLGLATPGHVRALQQNPGVRPVLAQQSSRELRRTGRSFADVLDAATFGAFASGWTGGFGADADHMRTIADIDGALAGGCSMITVDPVDVIRDLPAHALSDTIEEAYDEVPWDELEDDEHSFARRYPAALDLGTGTLKLPVDALRAAAARFGPAVARVARLYRHVVAVSGGKSVDFEVAVDETGHHTTPVDHVYLATELHRLGVTWDTFAPRFVGSFEKGIDHIGDPDALVVDVATHAAIARALGPYRLSIHSGSDKFSIHELLSRAAEGTLHLKTSGTSYLTALAVIAAGDPDLVREVWRVALGAYAAGRESYNVSASATRLPRPDAMSPADIAGLLEDADSRQILHVTFGAILGPSAGGDLAARVHQGVWSARRAYWARLADHMAHHLRPFALKEPGPVASATGS